jgi:hypothetical protein
MTKIISKVVLNHEIIEEKDGKLIGFFHTIQVGGMILYISIVLEILMQ